MTIADLPAWFKFQPQDTVKKWVANSDGGAITRHAWQVWAAVTAETDQAAPSSQRLRVFETWWNRPELLADPTGATTQHIKRFARTLEVPRQLVDPRPLIHDQQRPEETLFSQNKYNKVMRKHVADKGYFSSQTMQTLNSGWGATPVADRKVEDFPDDAIMLKPLFRVVSGSHPTIMSYWAGPVNSTTPATPAEDTWTKKMVVVPASIDKASIKIGSVDGLLPVVSTSDFHSYRLTTPEEVEGVKQAAARVNDPVPDAAIGDYVLLVAMHVSTREIDDWTWQTFWWSLQKPSIPEAAREHLQSPFDHYQVAVGYSFMMNGNDPNSLPIVCYSPYLEAQFDNSVFGRPGQLGIESNCMSCHRLASWPRTIKTDQGEDKLKFIANGLVDPGDPALFGKRTKTDFVWGMRNIPIPTTNPSSP
jgi:hypothetical protein